jgi:diacylglycerol kinase (ATP)
LLFCASDTLSTFKMRAAAILGLGCSARDLKPFQGCGETGIEWRMGMPASGDEADVVLLFGGDGTIHRHLGQLVRLGLPVLVVPVGSGNDFARALGLRRLRDSLAAWRKFCGGAGNVRRVDLGVISAGESAGGAPFNKLRAGSSAIAQGRSAPQDPRYFCCVAGVGLDGEVARRANGLPRWRRGHGGYLLSLLPTILRFAPLPMKISVPADGDGDPGWTTLSEQPTILAAFANTPVYGGGMKIAPQARMDDGLLDVCVVGGIDRFKLFCMFPTIYSGGHLNIKEVDYFQAGRVRVETEHPLDVYADGEFVGRTPVEVGLEPAALKVVVSEGE